MVLRRNTIPLAAAVARDLAPSPRSGAPGWCARGLTGLVAVVVLGCGAGDNAPLPPDVEDPATLQTPAGAMARYRQAIAQVGGVFDGAMTIGGTLTDELTTLPLPLGFTSPFVVLNSRSLVYDTHDGSGVLQNLSRRLHRLRAQAREGRGFLDAYALDSSLAFSAHLFAVEGYAELFLADLFCSGIPLSTVEFGGDYTLAAGSTTAEVYDHARALFDSALARASGSEGFQYLAAVGRGRALVALGEYAEAGRAVAAVPTDYRYEVRFKWSAGYPTLLDSANLFWLATSSSSGRVGGLTMGDQEGGVGLTYISSGDPRTLPWTLDLQDVTGNRMYLPRKYTPGGAGTDLPASPTSFTMASGVEARLIEAEAALQAGSAAWLTALNALRTTGTFDLQPNAANPAVNDTLWHAGSGSVPGLRPLDDPGSDDARVDLLFRERAFWLYLTAQRQGDLRRLIRLYLRTPDSIYPRGVYAGGIISVYGSEVTVPVPESESLLNPKYIGCFHRNA